MMIGEEIYIDKWGEVEGKVQIVFFFFLESQIGGGIGDL